VQRRVASASADLAHTDHNEPRNAVEQRTERDGQAAATLFGFGWLLGAARALAMPGPILGFVPSGRRVEPSPPRKPAAVEDNPPGW
jgi:hypothetical protein